MFFLFFSSFYFLFSAFLITFILILIVKQQHHHHQSSYHRLRRLWYTWLYNLSSSSFLFRFIIFSSCRLVHGAFLFLFLFLITSLDSKNFPFVVTYVGSTYYLDIMLTTPLAYFSQASALRFSSSSSSSLIFFWLFYFSLHASFTFSQALSLFFLVSSVWKWYPHLVNISLISLGLVG